MPEKCSLLSKISNVSKFSNLNSHIPLSTLYPYRLAGMYGVPDFHEAQVRLEVVSDALLDLKILVQQLGIMLAGKHQGALGGKYAKTQLSRGIPKAC